MVTDDLVMIENVECWLNRSKPKLSLSNKVRGYLTSANPQLKDIKTYDSHSILKNKISIEIPSTASFPL